MNTSGATLDMSQMGGVFFGNDLYTLEIHNMEGTPCILGGFFRHTVDARTSEQQLISFQTSYFR